MGATSVLKPLAEEAAAKTGPLLQDAKNYILKSGGKVLQDLGEGGTALYNLLKSQETQKSVLAGQHVSDISKLADIAPIADRINIGLNPASGSQIAPQMWQGLQAKAQDIAQELGARGAKVLTTVNGKLQRVPIYLPNDFMPKVLSQDVFKLGTMRNELIDHLVNTQQMPSRFDAETFVRNMQGMMFGRKGVEIMHDLGGMNVPAKFLENDPKVAFSAWADSASQYITKADNYGPRNQNIKTLLQVIQNETDSKNAVDFAKDAVDAHEYGYGNVGKKFYEAVTPVESWLRNFEGLTKLSRVFVAEPSQAMNTLILTDAKSFAKGVADIYRDKDSAVDFALKSGALLSQSMQDFKAAVHGRDSWVSSMLHYTGFDWERKMNIVLSANAGKNYAQSLADDLLAGRNSKEVNSMLPTLGLNPSAILRQGGLTPEDTLIAGRKAAEITQFFHNPLDLPLYWSKNPFTRTASLYKNFIYNQMKFTKDILFKKGYESGKLPQNLAYASILFPVVGELVGDMEGLLRGQTPQDRVDNSVMKKAGVQNDYAARYLDNLSRVGHIAMFYSMLGSMNRGNVVHWLGGPVAGDIEDFTRAGYYLAKGNPKQLEKTVASRIPLVGGVLANKMKKGN